MTKHNVQLPSCVCGASLWSDHGCHVGGPLAQFGKRCNACGRIGQQFHHAGGALFIVPIGETFGPSVDDWFNGPTMATLRTRAADFDAAYNDRRAGDLAAVNVALGLPASTKGDTVPKALYREWANALDARDAEAHADVRNRPEFRDSPTPPRVPTDVLCYSRTADGWTRHTAEDTAAVPVPIDPIRLAHDKTFARIFDDVRTATGVSFAVREIPNRYYRDDANNEPWFTFEARGVTFTIGPRKRVIIIAAEPVSLAMRETLYKFGTRDDTTHNGGSIHAWSATDAVEYLAALIRGAS